MATDKLTGKLVRLAAEDPKVLAEASAPPAPPSFLKSVRNHVFDLVSTILGATPSFSIHKVILPPKD